jgi:hypothetical protein
MSTAFGLILRLAKNQWPEFTLQRVFAILLITGAVSLGISGLYISLAVTLIYVLSLQDLLVFLTLAITHICLSTESHHFTAYLYALSGPLLVLLTAVLALSYTLDNPAITGQNAR